MLSRRTIGALGALLAVILGCFFMPDYVSGLIDRNTLGHPTTVDTKSISFEARPNRTIPERLTLFAGTDHESLPLKNGKLSESDARAQVQSELRRFFGTSELGDGLSELTINECAPMFVIDDDELSIMIVWRAMLSSKSGQALTVTIDEETGVILQMLYKSSVKEAMLNASGDSDFLYDDAKRLEELISSYYGMPAELNYEPGGEFLYYNVELDYGTGRVALYGIVRESVFTVNE